MGFTPFCIAHKQSVHRGAPRAPDEGPVKEKQSLCHKAKAQKKGVLSVLRPGLRPDFAERRLWCDRGRAKNGQVLIACATRES